LGLWLAEKERFDDAIWIVEQFIDDPDPDSPEKYVGDENFNHHQKILENEDVNIITTVLGHLAWVIQKLAMRKNYIVKALEFTEKLLTHPNLYVKLQALVPLVEISARRQWLEEYDSEHHTNYYERFRKTTFSLLKNYSRYKSFAESLTHVFYYFKDLDSAEAMKVLDNLEKSSEAAALFVYFGIYRERHYKGKVKFDQKPLKEKLEAVILSKDGKYLDLKGSIAWNFWRILEETPDEFDVIKPYLDLFFSLPYNKRYYSSLDRIIEEWIERKADICISWFVGSIDKLFEYVNGNEAKARNTWVEPGHSLQFVASNKPSFLISLVGKLVELWKLGAFVGSPRELFETYKLIPNPNEKDKAKAQFKSWYEEMKALNPKLETVLWE